MNEKILLPGSGNQLENTLQVELPENPGILVLGSFSEKIAQKLSEKFGSTVEIIVEDTESFLNTGLVINSCGNIRHSLMSFEMTDFKPASFDLVYAQASVSNDRRNKIVKEIKRILKPGGLFSAGEIVKLKKDTPPFVANIFSSSSLDPLYIDDLQGYYSSRNFKIIDEKDYSGSLKEYYEQSARKLDDSISELSDNEKKYYKKLLNKISHETNAYLKLGAEKYIGFKYLLLQKGEN